MKKYIAIAATIALSGCDSSPPRNDSVTANTGGSMTANINEPVANRQTVTEQSFGPDAPRLLPNAPGLRRICFVLDRSGMSEGATNRILESFEDRERPYRNLQLRLHLPPGSVSNGPRRRFLEPCIPPPEAGSARDGVLVIGITPRDGLDLRFSRGEQGWEGHAQSGDIPGWIQGYLSARMPVSGPDF